METGIYFCDNLDPYPDHPGSVVVRLPSDLRDKQELFRILSVGLDFPGYFGDNWDALLDCLCDLHWIQAYDIYIVHDAVPLSDSITELRLYLAVLLEACKSWEHSREHALKIIFPADHQIHLGSIAGIPRFGEIGIGQILPG